MTKTELHVSIDVARFRCKCTTTKQKKKKGESGNEKKFDHLQRDG